MRSRLAYSIEISDLKESFYLAYLLGQNTKEALELIIKRKCMTTDQENELLQLISEIVELHEERGCVLTIHIENLADLLSEIDVD